jgi:hypothetical protein
MVKSNRYNRHKPHCHSPAGARGVNQKTAAARSEAMNAQEDKENIPVGKAWQIKADIGILLTSWNNPHGERNLSGSVVKAQAHPAATLGAGKHRGSRGSSR